MSYAYLNALGEVIATAKRAILLVIVQREQPGAVVRISGAPDRLRHIHMGGQYHRKMQGDGTKFEHYILVRNIRDVQDAKILEIDATTRRIIAVGFKYKEQQFSLSLAAQAKMAGPYLRTNPEWPVLWNNLDDTGTVEFVTAAALDVFCVAGLRQVRTALDSGTVLKVAIRAAITEGEIDAVIDSR